MQGFDVDVAKYIAAKLGVGEKGISFKEARSANRETFLLNGTVDMVLATYGITPARKTKVTFAGPYIITHQDVLVLASDNSVTSLADLKNKRVCQVSGSASWQNIVEGNNLFNLKVPAVLVPAEGYQECVIKLMGGALDAVSTDATILAGYGQRESSAVKVANAPFTDEKYGVGLRKGDVRGCDAVNKALTEMYQDGTARRLWTKWFGKTNLTFDPKKPREEGCG